MADQAKFRDWVEAVRPLHWIKSGFCLAALFFSGEAARVESWAAVLPLLAAFSGIASAGYLINDLINRKEDSAHPRKRQRPIASGRLPLYGVLLMAVVLLFCALGLMVSIHGFSGMTGRATLLCIWYFFLTTSYSVIFRRIPFADVLVLGAGFVLRVAAGAYALGLEPTVWLLGCTYSVALLLGFGKRLGEWRVITLQNQEMGATRHALRKYSENTLRFIVGVLCFLAAMLYLFYTLMHSQRAELLITNVPVMLGLAEYFRLAWRSKSVEAPERLIWSSRVLAASLVSWVFLVILISF